MELRFAVLSNTWTKQKHAIIDLIKGGGKCIDRNEKHFHPCLKRKKKIHFFFSNESFIFFLRKLIKTIRTEKSSRNTQIEIKSIIILLNQVILKSSK